MATLDAALAKPGKKSLKVLVTGFGPFRDIETNPSWLAAKPLNNQTLKFTKPAGPAHPHAPKPRPIEIEAHISAIEVPVTYSAVLGTVPPLHASKQYDVILHVGVKSWSGLAVERLAHKTGYNEPDAEGRRCDPVVEKPKADHGETEAQPVKRGFGRGFEEFGEELRIGVDVDEVVKHLKSKGLKSTSPSNDPGRYLCDFIYFCSLACARKEESKVKVLFMHVPPIGLPYQVEDMTKAIKGIIEYFALHAYAFIRPMPTPEEQHKSPSNTVEPGGHFIIHNHIYDHILTARQTPALTTTRPLTVSVFAFRILVSTLQVLSVFGLQNYSPAVCHRLSHGEIRDRGNTYGLPPISNSLQIR